MTIKTRMMRCGAAVQHILKKVIVGCCSCLWRTGCAQVSTALMTCVSGDCAGRDGSAQNSTFVITPPRWVKLGFGKDEHERRIKRALRRMDGWRKSGFCGLDASARCLYGLAWLGYICRLCGGNEVVVVVVLTADSTARLLEYHLFAHHWMTG
ncbi:hypothetical protein HDK90DRAFT_337108 [Phyllosticta capitalensis]|uniref:Uncharacterized protein n=1 Tax=Phyllosticta capitalensis TaxID=121624 RepID=A0ABR1YGE3_9PEZI